MKCGVCGEKATLESRLSVSEVDIRGSSKLCCDHEKEVFYLHEKL